MRYIKQCGVFIVFLIISSCATVPKEVVELSYTVGQDMEAVHASYKELIRDHFANLRLQTVTFIETRWAPTYLGDFVKTGDLITMAKDPDPAKAFQGVRIWAEVAVQQIEEKKKQLLTPIDNDEKALMESVDDAFARLIRANAIITAHLNSLRKVQEVQDETLQALQLKDIRDQINKQLILSSQKASQALDLLAKAEKVTSEADKQKTELLKKAKGD